MKKIALLLYFIISSVPLFAQDTDLLKRQAAMKVVKEQVGLLAPMALGKSNFDSFLAEAALSELLLAVEPFNQYFSQLPDNSSKTEASPDIWTNKKDFELLNTLFIADIQNAIDRESTTAKELKEEFFLITNNCKSCHQKYRIK
jgi:cytochrome c556